MYLILSVPSDLHARAVEHSAGAIGCSVELHGSLTSTPLSDSSIWLGENIAKVRVAGAGLLRSVWNRRPVRPELPRMIREEDRKFVSQQWHDHYQGLMNLSPLTGTFWVNKYQEAIVAESKAYQLYVAANLGFSVPKTLISNDPEEVRGFVSRVGNCVFKAFSPFAWVDCSSGNRNIAVTQNVTLEQLQVDGTIRLAPGIYQESIIKRHELRVTVVGDRQFAMQVTTRQAGVDWRNAVYEGDSDIQAVALPESLARKIHELLRALGLVYGTVDLGVDGDGKVYFFEINQAGQFLYVEDKLPEFPLLACFTSMFLQGRVDYSLPVDHAPMSFASYRHSEAYEGWLSEYEFAQLEDSPGVAYVK